MKKNQTTGAMISADQNKLASATLPFPSVSVNLKFASDRWSRTFLFSNTQWLLPSSSMKFHQRKPTSSRPVTFFTVQKSIEINRMRATNVPKKASSKIIPPKRYTTKAASLNTT